MASAPATTATTSKKPWRYYYVMAFPYSSGIPKEKVRGYLRDACRSVSLQHPHNSLSCNVAVPMCCRR